MVSASTLSVCCALLAVVGATDTCSDDTSLLQVEPIVLAAKAQGPSEIWEDFEDWRVGVNPYARMARRQVRETAKVFNMAQKNAENQGKANARAAKVFQQNAKTGYDLWGNPIANVHKQAFKLNQETVQHLQKVQAKQAIHDMTERAKWAKQENQLWRDNMRNGQQELRQGSREYTKSWRDFQTKDSTQKQMWKRDLKHTNAMAGKIRKEQRQATEVSKRQLETVERAVRAQASAAGAATASDARHTKKVMETNERLGNNVQESQAKANNKNLHDLRTLQNLQNKNIERQTIDAVHKQDKDNHRHGREERAMERISDRTERTVANAVGKVSYDNMKHLAQQEHARQQVYREVLTKHAATDLKDMAMDAAWKDASIRANTEIRDKTMEEIKDSPITQVGDMANAVQAMVAQETAQLKAQTDMAAYHSAIARQVNIATETARQAAENIARQRKAALQRTIMMSQGDDD